MDLMQKVENILESGNFNYCEYSGCFDIAASRDFTIFLKVLGNVDSFQETQATNLKIVSRNFNAVVALIGTHTTREHLMDKVVYERFDVPTFTPDTLESIVVHNIFPLLYRQRGGMFTEINPEKLRSERERAGLSQQQLADHAGTTKKSIYEHEAGRKKASLDIVKRIEKIVGNVTDPVILDMEYSDTKNVPKSSFERTVSRDFKNIGLTADSVYQTPFNILAHSEKILILSSAEENEKRTKKEAKHVSELSKVTKFPALAVTEKEQSLDIPSLTEKELREMNLKELRKKLK